jgi:hypothetical protein
MERERERERERGIRLGRWVFIYLFSELKTVAFEVIVYSY